MKVSNLQNGIAIIVAMSGGMLVIDRISEDGVRIANTETGEQLIVVLVNDELLFKGDVIDPSEDYITHPAIRGITDGIKVSDDCDCDCDEDYDDEDEDDYDDEDDCDEDDEDEDDEPEISYDGSNALAMLVLMGMLGRNGE